MDMVNDGKVIRLDTPQAVKEALASGKDLYNPETGELLYGARLSRICGAEAKASLKRARVACSRPETG